MFRLKSHVSSLASPRILMSAFLVLGLVSGSGGRGTIPVTYKGQTYYVCCTGCRDAFKEDPEKYLKEYAERKAKEKQANP